jgi:PAS domain S-box-containing protein
MSGSQGSFSRAKAYIVGSFGWLLNLVYFMSEYVRYGNASLGLFAERVTRDPWVYFGLLAMIPLFSIMGWLLYRWERTQQRFQTLFESANDGIYVRGVDGTMRFVNHKFLEIHGLALDQVLDRKSTDLLILPPEERERRMVLIQQAMNQGAPPPLIEAPFRRPDGSLGHVQVNLAFIREGGQTTEVAGIIRDITDRKRAEETVLRQNQYLAALYETTLGLVSRLDLNELLRDIVTRAGALVGTEHGYVGLVEPDGSALRIIVGIGSASEAAGDVRKPGEGMAATVWKTGKPLIINDYPSWSGRMAKYKHHQAVIGVPLKSGAQVVGVLALAHMEKDRRFGDEELAVLSQFAPLASIALDNARLYALAQQEIAERKQAQAALKASEQRLRLTMQQLPATLWTTDRELRFTSSTGAGLALLNLSPNQVVGLSLFEYFQTNDPNLEPIVAHRRALQGQPQSYLFRWEKGAWQTYVEPLQDVHGHVIGTIGIAVDVTEIKRAEDILRASKQQYETLVNSIEGIVWEADAQTLQFTFVSPQAERLLGYAIAQWLSSPTFWVEHIHPEDREWAPAYCAKATQEKKDHVFEYRMIAADGRTVWLRDFVHVVVENDRPVTLRGIMVDITDRRRLEDEIKKSEERYRDLIENATDMIIMIDLQGNLTYGNKKALEISGYTYEELVHKPFGTILVEDDLEKAALNLQKALQNEPLPPHVYRIRRKDGSILAIEVSSRLIQTERGEVLGIQTIARDVTEKKQLERERELMLAISGAIKDATTLEELTRLALEGLTAALSVTASILHFYDAEKRELYAVHSLGFPADLLRRIARQKVGQGEPGVASRAAWTQQVVIVEDVLSFAGTQFVRKEAEASEIRRVASVPLIAEAQLLGVLSIALRADRQITPKDLKLLEQVANELALGISRKRAEAAVQESEARYRELFENANDGIYTLDREGRFTSFNRKAEELTGFARNEVLGKRYSILRSTPAERRKAIEAFIRNLQGAAHRSEVTIMRKDGREIILELSTRPLLQGRQIVGIQGIARDITERKEIEKMKAEFISMVSHELRTPLTSIKGYTELVLAGDAGPVNTDQQEFLRIISQNTTRLTHLINDILDMERLESGQTQFHFQSMELGEVLSDVFRTFKVMAAEKQLDCHLELATRLVINGDSERLIQAFSNLVSNAIKYTPRGSITVRAYPDETSAQAVVEVSDTGIGMSAQDADRVFEKFYRASHEYVRRAGGTGLGLAIAKKTIDKHDGTIALSSELGRGSTFTVRLPLVRAAAGADDTGSEPRSLVLVIDDEKDIANLIKTYIERMGYRAEVAHSGQEGLRKARELRPDLITLDILLPDIDGFAAAAQLKKDAQTRSIPLIFLSIVHDRQKGLHLGASAYLTKPIDEERFRATVQQFLQSKTKPVLVVEDDPDFRRLIQRCLENRGFVVETAGDGVEALRKIKRASYQLVLLDKNLPRKSGLDVLLQMRAEGLAETTSVILVSGSPGAEVLEDQIEVLGAKKFLSKRLDLEALVAEIVDFLKTMEQTAGT